MSNSKVLEIIGGVSYVDLRTLRIRSPDLKLIAAKHGLKERQAVMFVNNAHTRIRLVAVLEKVVHLIIPGTCNDGLAFSAATAAYINLAKLEKTRDQLAELAAK